MNLIEDFTSLGRFDCVFCRNVLFYFEQSTRAEILGRISRVLLSGGYLVMSTSEALSGLTSGFSPTDPGSCLPRHNSGAPAAVLQPTPRPER